MIRSMTGYGRAQDQIGGRDITVEIRSVNHKFFEFNGRIPRAYGYLEEKLKSAMQGAISRGKVEAGVTLVNLSEGADTSVVINKALAGDYLSALRELGGELGVADDITLSTLSRFSDIFAVRRPQEDEEGVWAQVRQVADQAVAKFVAMREVEGARLREDVLSRLLVIEERVGLIERRSPETNREYRERLCQKLSELLGSASIDQNRILTEAAIVADRVAVDEETVRLRSHIKQMRGTLDAAGPVGKRLDFLVQEMLREANTIGSKAQDTDITMAVVDIKCEIEKIREQVQNIE